MNYKVGEEYTRTQVRELAGDPGQRGKWEKGYFDHQEELYVFANTNGESALGVNHDNRWVDKETLHWHAMKKSNINTPMMEKLLDRNSKVHIFTRDASDPIAKGGPFIYHGLGKADSYSGQDPVNVIWKIQADSKLKADFDDMEKIYDIEYNEEIEEALLSETEEEVTVSDSPEKYSVGNGVNELRRNSIKRNPQIASNAIKIAGYKCEVNEEHVSFTSKKTKKFYVEAHHIIPLSYQKSFKYKLDKEANIISLCPNCHRQFHYGEKEEKEMMLKKIYEMRKDRLEKVGITLKNYKELSNMY